MTIESTRPLEEGTSGVDLASRPGSLLHRPSVRIGLAAVIAVLAAGLTFVASHFVPATYSASTELLVTVSGTNGLGQDSVVASNQLTAQLVQIIPTDAVLAGPALKLGTDATTLHNAISVGTVAQENILQTTATGHSAQQAEQRASAVTAATIGYVSSSAKTQLAATRNQIHSEIAVLQADLQSIRARNTNVALARAQADWTSIRNAQSRLAELQASATPTVQELQAATTASQSTPKPTLYAAVAFLVAGFVALQLLGVAERRGRRL